MKKELEEIRDQQKASWNKFSTGWKKWDELTMDFLKPMADEIITSLNPKGNEQVLDIAAGTGEPGLSIAEKIPNGKVIITDLADEMLDVARMHAQQRGITNIQTIACDVSELPFPDNSFDAISCRFGFMFFPDMLLAAKEMNRVLKKGGKLACAVWNVPEKNFWVTAIGGTIAKNMNLTPPAPEAPGMFRCAKPGLMQEIFSQAGFHQIAQKEVAGKLAAGTAETYWNMMTDVAAPFVSALSQADEPMRMKIKNEVLAMVNAKYENSKVAIDSSALVIFGVK